MKRNQDLQWMNSILTSEQWLLQYILLIIWYLLL